MEKRKSSYLLVVSQCEVAPEEENICNREEWPDNVITDRENNDGTLSATKTDPFDVLPRHVMFTGPFCSSTDRFWAQLRCIFFWKYTEVGPHK